MRSAAIQSLEVRIKSIWDELMSLKSRQNIGARGLNVPSATKDFTGTDTNAYPDAREITAKIEVHFYTNKPINFPPFALLAYEPTDNFKAGRGHASSYWYEPEISNVEDGHISWVISSSYNVDNDYAVGRTYNIDVQVFSLLEGYILIEKIL